MNIIYDITPFTLLDYPDKPACIVWITGCNLRCKYCYNPDIVLNCGKHAEEKLLNFLETRVGRLEGVVFSGGECTTYAGLPQLIKKVKAKGFLVKIDTNGTNTKMIQSLLKDDLIDYIAMDFKGSEKSFKPVTGKNLYPKFLDTLKILVAQEKVKFEVRTTVHEDLLPADELIKMASILKKEGYSGPYYLQSYQHKENLGNISEPASRLDRNYVEKKAPLTIVWRDA